MTPNCESQCSYRVFTFESAVSLKMSVRHSAFTIWWMFLSAPPHDTMCSSITVGLCGNQTTNSASVTVTLYLPSYTEQLLLAWDYSKIFCNGGPNANTNSSTASPVHEKQNSFPIFHTALKCGAVFGATGTHSPCAVKGNAKHDDWQGMACFDQDIFQFTDRREKLGFFFSGSKVSEVCDVEKYRCAHTQAWSPVTHIHTHRHQKPM